MKHITSNDINQELHCIVSIVGINLADKFDNLRNMHPTSTNPKKINPLTIVKSPCKNFQNENSMLNEIKMVERRLFTLTAEA